MSFTMKGSPFKRAEGPGGGDKKKNIHKASINAARQLLKKDGINDPNLSDREVERSAKVKGVWSTASSQAKQAAKRATTDNYEWEGDASPLKKQKLSKEAAARKKKRDLAYAKTPARRAKKADAQARRRKAGAKAKGKDWDHKDGRWETPKENRGNGGKGTKSEGKKKYYVKKRRKK